LQLQKEIKQEQLEKSNIEAQFRGKIEQLKEKIKNERQLRGEANATLEQLNKKVKDLDAKYQKELLYYKEISEKKENEINFERAKIQRIFENVFFY